MQRQGHSNPQPNCHNYLRTPEDHPSLISPRRLEASEIKKTKTKTKQQNHQPHAKSHLRYIFTPDDSAMPLQFTLQCQAWISSVTMVANVTMALTSM